MDFELKIEFMNPSETHRQMEIFNFSIGFIPHNADIVGFSVKSGCGIDARLYALYFEVKLAYEVRGKAYKTTWKENSFMIEEGARIHWYYLRRKGL